MSTRGQHRAGTATTVATGVVAGLTLLALGAGAPAQADQPNPGKAPVTKTQGQPAGQPKAQLKPVQDVTAPARPALGEASVAAGGAVSLGVQAEEGSALVVREGSKVVASASATGSTQTLSWRTKSGPHTYLVVATDAAGNASDGSPVTIEVDATPPAAQQFTVKPGTARDSRTTWSVVTDPGTAYTLVVDGKTVAQGDAEGRKVTGDIDLTNGRHDVTVQLRDKIGNLREVEDTMAVDIPALWVAAKAVSAPTDTTQVFKVAAPPATRGFLRIPGVGGKHFDLTDGRAEVTMEVPEGSYDAPVVVVADSVKRHGTTELEPFAIDTTAPGLEVTTIDAAAERGMLSATIKAESGDTISWKVLTDSGFAVLSGEYVADGTDQLLERELGKGSFTLEVTATDANGNASSKSTTATIAARPLINPDVVPALVITLTLWVLVGLVIFLRRRAARMRLAADRGQKARRHGRAARRAAQAEAAAEYETALAAYEQESLAWEQRRADLAQLVAVAEGAEADLSGTGIELAADERAFCAVPAALVELQERDGVEVPVEVDHGRLVVTDARVLFVGTESRDWEFAKLQSIRHLDDRTLIAVSNRPVVSGVSYADADVVRLYLELALAEAKGTSRSVLTMLKQGVRSHELRRPQAPAPLGEAAERVTEVAEATESTESTADPAPAAAPVMVTQGTVADQTAERALVLSKS